MLTRIVLSSTLILSSGMVLAEGEEPVATAPTVANADTEDLDNVSVRNWSLTDWINAHDGANEDSPLRPVFRFDNDKFVTEINLGDANHALPKVEIEPLEGFLVSVAVEHPLTTQANEPSSHLIINSFGADIEEIEKKLVGNTLQIIVPVKTWGLDAEGADNEGDEDFEDAASEDSVSQPAPASEQLPIPLQPAVVLERERVEL